MKSQDRLWVKQTLSGNREAFAHLVNEYQNAVYNLCVRMLGDTVEAEDAAQETFLRAYAHLGSYDSNRSFKTWLLSIASNHCIDRLRKRRLSTLSLEAENLPPHPALTSSDPGPEASIMASERTELVQKLLSKLPPDYRAAVVLYYWYDYSQSEIAEVLGTTESAVKSRLFRARRMMAEMLKQRDKKPVRLAMEGSNG